jgi:hypothetical protein
MVLGSRQSILKVCSSFGYCYTEVVGDARTKFERVRERERIGDYLGSISFLSNFVDDAMPCRARDNSLEFDEADLQGLPTSDGLVRKTSS